MSFKFKETQWIGNVNVYSHFFLSTTFSQFSFLSDFLPQSPTQISFCLVDTHWSWFTFTYIFLDENFSISGDVQLLCQPNLGVSRPPSLFRQQSLSFSSHPLEGRPLSSFVSILPPIFWYDLMTNNFWHNKMRDIFTYSLKLNLSNIHLTLSPVVSNRHHLLHSAPPFFFVQFYF